MKPAVNNLKVVNLCIVQLKYEAKHHSITFKHYTYHHVSYDASCISLRYQMRILLI